MAECIEREALLSKTYDITTDSGIKRVVMYDDIVLAPVIDAVEVVRCCDCKYCISDGDDGDGNEMLHFLNSSNFGC